MRGIRLTNKRYLNILLFSGYMPCDAEYDMSNLHQYNAILQEMIDLGVLLDVNKNIIAGDFNTEFTCAGSLHTTAPTAFMDMQNFTRGRYHDSDTFDQYTYESKISGEQYTIDHILVTENVSSLIKIFQVIANSDKLSDHHPVSVCFDLNIIAYEDIYITPNKRLLWSAATNDNINMYQSKLEVELNNITLPINALYCKEHMCHIHSLDPQQFHDGIINACLTAGELIPCTISEKSKCVPGWSEYAKEHKNRALFWHSIWRSCNSPSVGYFVRYKT